MFRSIFSFIGALIGYVWSFLRVLRWPITILAILGITVVFFLSGYAFKVVYDGIILFLIIFAIISLWIQPLRWVLLAVLVAGGIFYAYNILFLGLTLPYVNDVLSKNFPAYQELKETEKKLANNKLAERTISVKKEILGSEVTKGTFGIMLENSVVYDESGSVIQNIQLKKGQKIMSLGIESEKQSDGSEGMAYVCIPNENGHFVKGVKVLVPIRMIKWESDKNQDGGPTPPAKWELVEKRVVDFSKLKMERFDQKLNFPVIPVSLNKLGVGNYRIKLSGNWEFFMSSNRWREFPWNGGTYANNLPEFRPDKSMGFASVILLNNGENITPVNTDGFILNSTGSVNLSLKINVLMRADEFYSDRITDRASKLTLANSEKEPITITIEKEVK